MYCVIQKIFNKKPNSYGTHKEIIAEETTWIIDGTPGRSYYYSYSDERFERSIKDAYKISIHKSYREKGKLKKKQWVGVITASVTPGAKYMVYIQKTFSVLCPEGFFNFYYPEILYISIGNLSFIFKSKFPYGLT